MVKGLIQVSDSRRFYVLKHHVRRSDPDKINAARSTARAKCYSQEMIEKLMNEKIIVFKKIDDVRMIFVDERAPLMLGGKIDGFWKLFQKRYHCKHVSTTGISIYNHSPFNIFKFTECKENRAIRRAIQEFYEESDTKKILPSFAEFCSSVYLQ